MRAVAVVALALAAAVAVGARAAQVSPLEREVRDLGAAMERIHPDLFHDVAADRFRAEVDALARSADTLPRPRLVAGLMRLAALPGARDGHTAVYPYDAHPRPLRVYPLRLYAFPDGMHVVAFPARRDLVGARLTAVDGVPIERVVAAVEPLVSRDNEWSVLELLPEHVVTEEVLVGLGLVDGGATTFTFADGRSATLQPVPAPSFAGTGSILVPLRAPRARQPIWLRHPERAQWLTVLDRGRAVYLGYRETTGETWTVSRRLLALARRPGVRRVIVDVRLNHGGDNTTYGALLDAMQRLSKTRSVRLLVGRATFSAAGNFAADVDRIAGVRILGEPTGGAPSQWGDATAVTLPLAGLVVRVATSFWLFGPPGDTRSTTMPDVSVPLTAADFFAGRDPVLRSALSS